MSLSEEDLNLLRGVVKTITSERYKDKNYVFLHPFDLSQTPGYLDVVKNTMDLETLSKNLEAGMYTSQQAFFKDCFTTFENAVAYHGNRKESKWIAKLGKEMLKVAKREEKILEKKKQPPVAAGGSGKQPGKSMILPTKKNEKSAAEAESQNEGGATKLKLKLGGPKSAPAPISKPKIKLGLAKQPTEEQASAAESGEVKKPKLKLKLGLKLKPSSSPTPLESTSDKKANSKPSDNPSTPKSASSGSGKISIKMTGAGAGSRGKELPAGVSPPKAEPKKTAKKNTSKKTTKKEKSPSPTPDAKHAASKSKKPKISLATNRITPDRKAQCAKVLNGLKRRKVNDVWLFLQPVSDKNILIDYKAKIENPMDLQTMETKLEKNQYQTVGDFVLDLRRILSNCLRYNTSSKTGLRQVAVNVLTAAEELCTVFLAKKENPSVVYQPLLYCWKTCNNILDALFNLINPGDGQQTALYFFHPVPVYTGGQWPDDYLAKVKKPMDFGTVTRDLIEGTYASFEEFEADCRLVVDNCITYYGGKADGKIFTDQANRLKTLLQQQIEKTKKYLKSPAGTSLKTQSQLAITTATFPKPPIPLLLKVIEEMRALKYTDKATKITEPAMGPFEKPVDLAAFRDYTQIIETPIDLQTVERNAKIAFYKSPEDFEYDFLLIFQNCIAYNSARKTDHLVAMGKYGMKSFKRIFAARMKAFDDPTAVPSSSTSPESIRKAPPDGGAQQGPPKKIKLDPGVSRGKTGPRISLTSTKLSVAAEKAPQIPPRSKSPKPTQAVPKTSMPKTNPNVPVPLHIAIAQIKEQFPSRRAVKTLTGWEAGCARFFKEMMRHSWISAARPKFMFHIPVPVLFPGLRDAYAEKIKKPMDLTTVECILLAGNRYRGPEDFITDVALVFANSITFNKAGRDLGDPLSCAYYDASIHLLRYIRWLSLEILSDWVKDSEHVDVPEEDGLPLISWELTNGNKKKAREEMEVIVLKEFIEKSLEGDRYTWMEAECEKLLKALRHISDNKFMHHFLHPNYPADYAAFIAKPMDWERCQKTLKKRQYDKFGDVIADLRLIFSNALKYNAQQAGLDTAGGKAYEGAKYMSAKLEIAINKMMLTVSDRIERERIDHNNAEREIEAAERAEDDRIRAQWRNENAKDGESGGSAPPPILSTQRIRTTKRTVTRRENTDFEVPFFDDEDDGQHERSYHEAEKNQRDVFNRQRAEMVKMRQAALNLGSSVFLRMMHRDLASKFVADERKKLGVSKSPDENPKSEDASESNTTGADSSAKEVSSVYAELDKKERNPFQLKLLKPRAKPKKKRKHTRLLFEEEEEE